MFSGPPHAESLREELDRGWYALYTRSRHEKAVARALTAKGFKVFLPLYAAPRQWKDRTKVIMLPLFSCYVFIQGYSDRYLDIVRTAGVHDFVCCAGLPAPISSGAIEDIRQVVERSIKIDPHPFIRCGDRVRVKSGPLEGIEGVLVRKKNLSRLVLTVELLGKSAAVEIDVSLVERISLRGRCFASTERRYDCLTFTHVKSSPYVVPSDFTDKQLSAELWAK